MRACCTVLGLITAQILAQGAPIFPDGDFSLHGNTDGGRGGGRCLTVSGAGRVRWRGSRAYQLKIEPFARYRVTGYAKARGRGGLRALMGYGWNSYDWRYECGQNVPADGQWHRYAVTFACPQTTYTLHPAALLGAEDGQVWVDDVTVEKIAEPAEVIAMVAAKPTLSMLDREFLARAHLAAGKTQEAAALAEGAEPYTRADIFCALALAAKGPAARGAWFARMLANGGPAYSNALTRLNEIAANTPQPVLLAWLDGAAATCTEGDAAMGHAVATMHYCLRLLDQAATCVEARKLLTRATRAEERARALLAAKRCMPRFGTVCQGILDRLAGARKVWQDRFAKLGTCTITINGSALGARTHDVVVPADAARHEKYAARELRLYLERLTGTAPDLAIGAPAAGKSGIYVGRPPKSVATRLAARIGDLGEEAFLIETRDRDLYIVGGLRGALYGVYTLLEDHLGCGWYMPGPLGEVVPTTGTFALTSLRQVQRPSFTWRGLSGVYDAQWCIRNKVDPTISGARHGVDKGDPAFFGTFGHNYARLVPAPKYFLAHSEYFSLIKGERKWDHTQLCTTNPDVIRLCAEGICRDIERHPDCKVFALCQNDWAGWCECANCRALDVRDDSVTDRILVFCNAVSKLVRERYPDKQIYTYAYQKGVEPPEKVVPDPALGVQLCHIRHPCSHSHPIETATKNTEYKRWVEGWTAATKQLFVYDYRVDYSNYLMPYPNCYAILEDVPYYHRRGVRNLFYQGGGNGHNFGLCHYLLAKLMWNVNADREALVSRFFNQYYGPAATPMQAYWKLLHDTVVEKQIEMNLYSTPPAELFTPEFIRRAEGFFAAAQQQAGSQTILDRIAWERITLYWVKLALARRDRQIVWSDTKLSIRPGRGTAWRSDLAEFIRIAKTFGIWRIRESSWRGDVDIRGFISEVSGLDVHDYCDYRYPANESAEGQRCVTVRANVAKPFSGWRQRYPMILRGNRQYRATCRIRTQGDDAFAAVPLELRGGITQATTPVTGTTAWHSVAFDFRTPALDSVPVSVQAARVSHGTGQVWIDDIRVVEIGGEGSNLVQNGGFERRRGTEPDYWIRPGNGSSFAWAEMSPVKEFLANPATYPVPGEDTRDFPVVTLQNSAIRVDVIPGLGGRIQRIVDRRSGANICYNAVAAPAREGWTNYGGYEEYTSPALGGPGWDCPYQAELTRDGGQTRLVLTATLADRRIQRVITVPQSGADLRIESTVTNLSQAPIKARLRIHPVFQPGGRLGDCVLFSRRPDGEVGTHPLANRRQDLWLKGADFAHGAWALRAAADGAGILNRFDPKQVDTTYICVQPGEGINLELMSPVTMLKPAASLRLSHAYRLIPPGTKPAAFATMVK